MERDESGHTLAQRDNRKSSARKSIALTGQGKEG
jgi:hypothetical protein